MTITVTPGDLAWIVPSGLTVLTSIVKTQRQQKRIEEGVGGYLPQTVLKIEKRTKGLSRRAWLPCRSPDAPISVRLPPCPSTTKTGNDSSASSGTSRELRRTVTEWFWAWRQLHQPVHIVLTLDGEDMSSGPVGSTATASISFEAAVG